MPTLHVMTGIPGSGKSTYVQKLKGHIVCPDDFRALIFGPNYRFTEEEWLWKQIIYPSYIKALDRRIDVIFDGINLVPSRRWMILEPAVKRGYVAISHFMDTPLKIALENNAKRDRHVPEERIRDANNRLVVPDRSEGFKTVYRIYNGKATSI